jgi:hypothetical protein
MWTGALFSLAFSLATSVPDATLLRPERMLEPTEILFDVGAATFFSNATKTPTGGVIADRYLDAGLRARLEVGVLKFLKTTLTLPLLDITAWTQQGRTAARFGDPTFGLAAGGSFQHIHFAGFAELQVPTAKRTLLFDATSPLARGQVVAAGRTAVQAGAFIHTELDRGSMTFRSSARVAYRLNTEGASHGLSADVRTELVLVLHALMGLDVVAWIPFRGDDTALVSASRASDSAGWVDVVARLGWRFSDQTDLSAAFSAPLYTFAGGLGFTAQLVASLHFGPW